MVYILSKNSVNANLFCFFLFGSCAARGHALAVWLRLALPSPLRSDPLADQTRSAQRNIIFTTSKNLKKAISLAKAPSHEKRVQHWTCGAFGMRGRCRLSCHSQVTACGRAPSTYFNITTCSVVNISCFL